MKSKTGNQEVSDTTYIAELVMIRKYDRERKKLPSHFWNLPEYKEEFQKQKIQAVKLRKIFSTQSILSVLKREGWIFSLYLKKLPNLLKIEERKLDKLQKIINSSEKSEPLKKRKRETHVSDTDLFTDLDD